ncbi:restriction endonuclease subunit S [Staphylococcus americanisciuri]|uniref:Restriction endonuclease subunit S n=1 Tax=Staphylococcus americanisciuri TaxID=2973940 RepID=A0ABT2F0N2_9STAP|nr:restriction endonuclease subunit S [Staphylococcus americanisciuri]MCS4485897.1 restriction endonuclease subunit S [Staphylococcus americanisciuri]
MKSDGKNVPELRFPEFSGEWEEKKIGELANIVRGASPRPISNPIWFDDNSDIGWLRIADVTEQNGRIHHLKQRISVDGQAKTRVVLEKHLLLSIAASVGKPVINYVKTGVHDGFLIFKNPVFDIEFMFQWLEFFKYKWQKYGQPGSQTNLNADIVKLQDIYIPNRVEQIKIGDFFSKFDQQIELEEKKLDLLEKQKKGYLQKIFSQEWRFKGDDGNEYPEWEEKELREITKYSSSKRSSSAFSDNTVLQLYPVYDANKIIGTSDDFDIKESYISIIKDGAGVGRIELRPGQTSVISTMGYIMPNRVDVCFLYYNLKLIRLSKYIIGSTIPHIYYGDYSREKIRIPSSIEEQKKIGSFLAKIDELIENKFQKINTLREQKQGLLQKMLV